MEWGALARAGGPARAVDFADDDSVPARDLITGERLEAAPQRPGAPVRPVPVVARGSRSPADAAATARRTAPVVLAQERRLEVAAAIAPLLPEGIRRGSTVGVRGAAAVSLALAVVAGPMASGSWLAVVGGRDLCLAGAEQSGVVLHRTVLVDEPSPGAWGSVVAALVDAFDLVLLDGRARIGAGEARRLSARVRERGSVLVDIGGVWPEGHDTVLEVVGQHWVGLGDGHGVLTGRSLTVAVSGRRGATRQRTVQLWLPEPASSIVAAHAGADIDALIDADPAGVPAAGAHLVASDHDADVVALRRVG